ncbi:unnamed protein product, partial [Meganyctiphanes norvegica]
MATVKRNGDSYVRAIAGCRKVLDQAISLGFTPSILDIGGGFPLKADIHFTAIAAAINETLDQYFPNDGPIEVIAEPGRYIAGTALSLVTMITSRRLIKRNDGEIMSAIYYLNDGIYGSFHTIKIINRIVKPKIIRKTHSSEDDTKLGSCIASDVWGPTCDSYDKVGSSMDLPLLSVGDWLFWPDMGDYTLTLQSSFNSYTKASIQYCKTNI